MLTEKRRVDKENMELEYKLQGKGMSEKEQKDKQFEAEREQKLALENRLEFKEQEAELLNEQLKEEEALAKDMLDALITAKQELETFSEDADDMRVRRLKNRDDIIRQQIKNSQLKAANGRTKEELVAVTEDNEKLQKDNEDLLAANEKLSTEIALMIQRIDLNTLLKEIDIEEMRLQARNNQSMNMEFMKLLTKWNYIAKKDE